MKLIESILINLDESSLENFVKDIWGSDSSLDDLTNEEINNLQDLKDKIEYNEDCFFDGDISLDQFLDILNKLCREHGLINAEINNIVNLYKSAHSKDIGDTRDNFVMTNGTKRVTIWKDNERWIDSDGNKYMGYLSKDDVKRYFDGEWSEYYG